MSSTNWARIAIAVVIGILMGLVYGWVVSPVQYTDVTPSILRADYRADYVLMVAEAFHSEFDSEAAARRLAMLGSDTPEKIVSSTLDYARANNFTQDEIKLLQDLLSAMQTYQPQDVTP